MMECPRVIMIAPGCDPTDVGESWSCYQWVAGMAKHCQVTLLTLHRKNQVQLEKHLPGVRVIDWPDLQLPRRFERFQSMAKPGYLRFYRKSRSWIRQALIRGERFDLTHQVGPIALRYACPATGLGIPTIIGPLAGSLPTPTGFAKECRGDAWYLKLRSLDRLRLKFDRKLRRSYASANIVLGVAPYVGELLAPIGLRRFELASETGVADVSPAESKESRAGEVTRLLFVGRLIRTKGLRDLIRALGKLPDKNKIFLDVAGCGPDLDHCRREADGLGVLDRIQFHGQLPRQQVESLYQNSDVFVFPSFREPSGNVVFEAMRYGLPVITTDRGGPSFVVDDRSGIKTAGKAPRTTCD